MQNRRDRRTQGSRAASALVAATAVLLCAAAAYGQETATEEHRRFGASFGVGYPSAVRYATQSLYHGGITTTAELFYTPPSLRWLEVGVHHHWAMTNVRGGSTLSFSGVGPRIKTAWPVLDWLELTAGVAGGPFVAWLENPSISEWSAWLEGSAGLRYRFGPLYSLGLEGAYREHFGLHRDIRITLESTFRFGGGSRTPRERTRPAEDRPQLLEREEQDTEETAPEIAKDEPQEPTPAPRPDYDTLSRPTSIPPAEAVAAAEPAEQEQAGLPTAFGRLQLVMDPIFPVFYSHYDQNPLGIATVTNTSDRTVEDLSLSLYIAQYMDNPKDSARIVRLEPGASAEVEIFALFTSDILEITEGAKLSGRFRLGYTMQDEERTEEFVQTVNAHNRNALTWDDDRKICAFVTAKDPAVMRFARNTSGEIQAEVPRGVNSNLTAAMGLHEALDVYGINYITDPTTPYEELSEQTAVVDYLLFPRQTLEYLGGDCDDLSALYAALLESVGVKSAFITIPGHIFLAFSLDMPPQDARQVFNHPDELIFRDNESWVPVEITLRDRGFLAAWQQGARQWREYSPAGLAGFYPVHEGWERYSPVGLPGSATIPALDGREVVQQFSREVLQFVEREIAAEVAEVQMRADARPEDARWPNRLGIIYARYGLDPQAISYFERALELRENYPPALVNLGSLHYLNDELFKALDYYEAAQEVAPDNPDVLLNIARVNHDLENYGTARRAYSQLQEVSPSLANRFAYLNLRGEEADRAAAAGDVEDLIIWAQEPEEE